MCRSVINVIALAVATTASAAGADRAAEVRAAELQRFQATTRGDLKTLAKLLADDLTYTHSNGILDGKPKYLEGLQSGRVRYESMEPAGLQVRVYGSTAVITGTAKVVVTSEGTQKKLQLRYTDVWVHRGGGWQMVAWQSTKLPEPTP